jgi:hypothetical protein
VSERGVRSIERRGRGTFNHKVERYDSGPSLSSERASPSASFGEKNTSANDVSDVPCVPAG